jgi:signal transduction histidine kinase/HPt (histidine-containing phosphotransfer) domain-containing protein
MKLIKTLLIIEDNPGDARLLREMLNDGSHSAELVVAATMGEAERYLSDTAVDIIVLDLGLPDSQGLDAVRRAHIAGRNAPLVVLTGLDDGTIAEQTLREGAQDYLIKGQIEAKGLLRALRYAIERKRLERLKDGFVSTVSHELRTPLTSIAASLGLLVGKIAGILPGPAARLLSIAYTNTQRLVRLVNDILDIEKLESGRVVFDLAKVNVRSLVEHAIEANRDFAESHNVRIRLLESPLVDEVRADADRLAQVLTNLLSNSIKFSPAGSEVVVSIAKRAESLRISLRDHGIGISADFRAHLFEKFAQADATNARQKGGTGLGLSIVKQIVERLGGEVGFDDAPGGGAVFHVDLPLWDIAAGQDVDVEVGTAAFMAIKSHAPAIDLAVLNVAPGKKPVSVLGADQKIGAAISLVNYAGVTFSSGNPVEVGLQEGHAIGETDEASSRSTSVRVAGDSKSLRILHVDDEADIRAVVEMSLGLDSHFTTRNVESGKEALAIAAEWMPDIILLDVMMPAMDGPATFARLRADKRTAGIPVVFMTARAQARELEPLNSLGAMGVIDKPFDPMTLAAVVRTYLPQPGIDLSALRDNFRKRVKLEAIVLGKYRSGLEEGSASTASLAGIRTIAHGLAGAGGIFGFDEISKAAASLEQAVIVELEETRGVAGIVPALESLLDCAATFSAEARSAEIAASKSK